MMIPQIHFNVEALLNRITVESFVRPIMFVLGSPLTSPDRTGAGGVPDVNGIVDLIRQRLSGICDIDRFVDGLSSDRYHQALDLLKANIEDPTCFIRRAVLMARTVNDPEETVKRIVQGDRNCCYSLECDGNWYFAPGLKALGRIIAGMPDVFGQVVLTSNFDPLIEISVRQAGGQATSIGIDEDATPDIVARSSACKVVHFHGFWSGSGTLHRPEQLKQDRPKLLDAICGYLRNYTCVVLAYGGWDDIFMQALYSILRSRHDRPSIFWTYYNPDPQAVSDKQTQIMRDLNGLSLSREGFNAYYGIDVNDFLPKLFDRLENSLPHYPKDQVPSPDQKILPPTTRLEAFILGDEAYSAPYYPDSLWAVDRGCFLGLMGGSSCDDVYKLLVQTEGRIYQLTRTHPELCNLPVRWWIRFDARRLISRSDTVESLEYAAIDVNDPRFKYLRAKGLPNGAVLGAFLVMPKLIPNDQFVEMLRLCMERLESVVGTPFLAGVVGYWYEISICDLTVLLEESKHVWPSIAVDGLYQGNALTTVEGITTGRNDFDSKQSKGDPIGREHVFLRSEAKAVKMFIEKKLSEETFLREHGMQAFALALRQGLDFPDALKIASKMDLSCTDFWWLVTKLEPTSTRLRQITSLKASRRAIWGLCSLTEWNCFENYLQAQILDARQGRPLVLT